MRVRNKTICLLGDIVFLGFLFLGLDQLNAQTHTIKGVVTNIAEATTITGSRTVEDGDLAGTQLVFKLTGAAAASPVTLTLGADTTVLVVVSDLTRQIAHDPALTEIGLTVAIRSGKLTFNSLSGQLSEVVVNYKPGHQGSLGMEGRYVPVVSANSDLQLVFIPSDGGIPVSVSGGRFSSPSSLPKTAMPKKGYFSIECKDLKTGTYLIVAQGALLFPQRLAFLQKNGQNLRIEINEHTGPVLDVGDVTIPLNR
ncbi:MAG TPA: hypothetical protein VGE85_03465 [Terracidiphilus sp.]|jgi:hypothetical protein